MVKGLSSVHRCHSFAPKQNQMHAHGYRYAGNTDLLQTPVPYMTRCLSPQQYRTWKAKLRSRDIRLLCINAAISMHAWAYQRQLLTSIINASKLIDEQPIKSAFFNHHCFYFVTSRELHKRWAEGRSLWFFCFLSSTFSVRPQERTIRLIKPNRSIARLFTGVCVCLLNEWNWILNCSLTALDVVFSYNYSVGTRKKTERQKSCWLPMTSFRWSGSIETKQSSHTICISLFQSTVLNVCMCRRIKGKQKNETQSKEFIQICLDLLSWMTTIRSWSSSSLTASVSAKRTERRPSMPRRVNTRARDEDYQHRSLHDDGDVEVADARQQYFLAVRGIRS